MLAAVFEGNGQLVLQERPRPTLRNENEALIKVTGVGICGTDLHILQVPPAHPATLGAVLGHEFTGEIVEVGSAIPDFKPGEAVIIDPHPGCGVCRECKQGHPDRCIPLIEASGEPGHPATIGIFSDGAMTSYMESGALPLERIVSHQLPLSQVHEGLNLLRQGQAIKVVLYPED